jgi:serine/threonine-protein kinase
VNPDPHEETLEPGAVLDRYEIVRRVATGGMGSVWLARLRGKHGFEKLVAIKTILPQYAKDEHFRRMFLDEARLSSRLEHANVAQILDLGEHDGALYIAFEWVEGRSLEQLCQQHESGRLPIEAALRVVADVCAGLHAAHELTDEQGNALNVVHRDMTPNNVLVSPRGFAKIIDFGVAKARGRLAGETRSGIVKGTPQYMAPEQLRADPIDRRADVWAAGAVLYRVVSGKPPFADRFELEAFIRKRAELAPLPDTIPSDVREIVGRALQRDRDDRYATADEMRVAIERVIQTATGRAELARAFGGETRTTSIVPSAAPISTPDELPFAETKTALPSVATTRSSDETKKLKIALAVAIAIAAVAVGVACWALFAS